MKPAAPPFIISSPSSATSIAVFWISSEGAISYVIERRQGGAAWTSIATLPASITYFTDQTALPATAYSYRVQAVNVAGASPYSPVTSSITLGQMEEWIQVNFGSPEALDEQEMNALYPDGTGPLTRYAFNLTADESARTLVPGISNSGLPKVWLDSSRNRLCVEMVRRKASANPGIIYEVQFANALPQWNSAGVEISTTSIDTLWERVRYEDTVEATQSQTRFCRVTVRRAR